MMFTLDLEKHTNAIFVGEPAGARPNHYGDSRKIRLPNSGLTLRVSTLYWQYAGPKDDRSSVPPQIPVRFVSDDLRTGATPPSRESWSYSRQAHNLPSDNGRDDF